MENIYGEKRPDKALEILEALAVNALGDDVFTMENAEAIDVWVDQIEDELIDLRKFVAAKAGKPELALHATHAEIAELYIAAGIMTREDLEGET